MCERIGVAIWAIASALLLFLTLTQGFHECFVVVGSGGLAMVVLCVCCYQRSRQQKLERFEILREARRQQRSKALASFEDQWPKPNFETRLQAFSKLGTAVPDEETFQSSMEFWQREIAHSETPTRPQSLFRYLLKRIARLVHGSH